MMRRISLTTPCSMYCNLCLKTASSFFLFLFLLNKTAYFASSTYDFGYIKLICSFYLYVMKTMIKLCICLFIQINIYFQNWIERYDCFLKGWKIRKHIFIWKYSPLVVELFPPRWWIMLFALYFLGMYNYKDIFKLMLRVIYFLFSGRIIRSCKDFKGRID